MARYLLKRLVWLLPTLWVITTLIFVFTKIAGGEKRPFRSGAALLHEGSGSHNTQDRLYKEYLRNTGQDLPLFYFSLKTLAEPDTLYRVFPARDRNLLKGLVLQYGNWAEIHAYFQHLVTLRKEISLLANTPTRQQLERLHERLSVSSDVSQAQSLLQTMYGTCSGTDPRLRRITQHLAQTKESADEIDKQKQPYKNLIPTLHWYGTANQYHQWFIKTVSGNFGNSTRDKRPVATIVGEALGITLWLTVFSMALVFAFALSIGVFLVHQDHYRWRSPILGFLYTLDTVPLFMLAFLILLVLSASGLLAFFPAYGADYLNEDADYLSFIFHQLEQLSIPALCLMLATSPYITGQVYQAIRQEEAKEYVRTARAKGQKEYIVIGKHALRNGLFPIITLFSSFLPELMGGVLVVEVIFSIPGMGRLLTDSVLAKDYPVVMGIVICLAFIRIIGLLVADTLYYLADPRIRF